MSKIASAAALMIATVASVSPALGREYCLERSSKTYRLLGELSRESVYIRASRGSGGWGQALTGKAMVAALKAIAKDHFHVRACPGRLTLSPEQIAALQRAVRELKN